MDKVFFEVWRLRGCTKNWHAAWVYCLTWWPARLKKSRFLGKKPEINEQTSTPSENKYYFFLLGKIVSFTNVTQQKLHSSCCSWRSKKVLEVSCSQKFQLAARDRFCLRVWYWHVFFTLLSSRYTLTQKSWPHGNLAGNLLRLTVPSKTCGNTLGIESAIFIVFSIQGSSHVYLNKPFMESSSDIRLIRLKPPCIMLSVGLSAHSKWVSKTRKSLNQLSRDHQWSIRTCWSWNTVGGRHFEDWLKES